MDEPAEQVAASYPGGWVQRRRVATVGWQQVERTVWPVRVVMAAVDAEQMLEMAAAEDQDSVEAVGAERADPALGVGRSRSALERECGSP